VAIGCVHVQDLSISISTNTCLHNK